MTPDGQIAIPLDIAAIREPFLAIEFCLGVTDQYASKAVGFSATAFRTGNRRDIQVQSV